jgi:hypothetical protein
MLARSIIYHGSIGAFHFSRTVFQAVGHQIFVVVPKPKADSLIFSMKESPMAQPLHLDAVVCRGGLG